MDLGELKPGNFEPFPKNPHIAQIFTQMGRSEELGTGVRNVYRYNEYYSNAKNNFFKEEDVFISRVPLNIFNEGINEGINEGTNEGTNEGIKLLLKVIIKNEGKRVNELAEIIKKPVKTVERWVSELKTADKIKYIGSNKSGGYYKKSILSDTNISITNISKDNFNEGINEGIKLLLKTIINNEGKRANELANIIKKPLKTVERWIAELKKEGQIEYIGSKKAGGYFYKK